MESQANESKKRQRDNTLTDNPTRVCGWKDCLKEHKTKSKHCPDCRAGAQPSKEELPNVKFHVLYAHEDINGVPMYIGEGSITRAYSFYGSSASRDPDHSEWMFGQMTNRHPGSVIKILESNLTKEECKAKETSLIRIIGLDNLEFNHKE